VLGLGDDWGDTTIERPPGTWVNLFTSERITAAEVRVSELLSQFPVALFTKEGGKSE